jgi:hypothetical protein
MLRSPRAAANTNLANANADIAPPARCRSCLWRRKPFERAADRQTQSNVERQQS